jgi:signal transduction histidine kinase
MRQDFAVHTKEVEKSYGKHLEQMEEQLSRLTHLEVALLVLARLDAGTLLLQKKEVDVFTLLTLAADNLQELFTETGTSIDIPEMGEIIIAVDLDWTMEAVMNLMKNYGTWKCRRNSLFLWPEPLIC